MWNQIECFRIEEAINYPDKWVIKPVHENFHLDSTTGSFNLIMGRVLGLSYAQYLRFCRDICGAEIYGKNIKYPVAYFKRGATLNRLVGLLNSRANLILWERNHPDWQEHQEWLNKLDSMTKLAHTLAENPTKNGPAPSEEN